ncbi:MSP domain protein [Oesophagostomum dentatum]|uniref:MSP domain protein n=1 Tax=Oesophagostomum dentatum TaxID=61180 RepID=A0A0B1RZX3_OESDE|nr:MSP domain protein [Oesophagostomum dentatum]
MATVPPGEIHTRPGSKIVFNAPYDDKHPYHIKLANASRRRIEWAIKTTKMRHLGVDPACGVFDPKETTLLTMSCDNFDYGREDTNNDRIAVKWCNSPEGWMHVPWRTAMHGRLSGSFWI